MLKAAIIALRNKLYSPARWVLGLSALIWLAVSFYLLCTSHYSIAAIFLAWAILHFISWAIFDRRRIFALGFGVLASGLYLQVAGIKVYSWGSKPPYYLQIIDVACCVLVVIFLLAWAAHIGSWAEQRRKDQPLEWKPWVGYWHEGNYPAWLLALGFVRSKKWRGWSITAGILGAIYWTCAMVAATFRWTPNGPALAIAIGEVILFLSYLAFLPSYFAIPWATLQLIGWVVQRGAQQPNST